MSNNNDILEGARSIRPYLATLLVADEARLLDDELAELLMRTNEGEKTDNRILELISEHDSTRQWMTEFQALHYPPEITRAVFGLSGSASLPGTPGPVDGIVRFACPQGDFNFFRRRSGEHVPPCPTHHVKLREAPASRSGAPGD